MPRVGILFELSYAETVPGENVCIVGSHSDLGDWTRSEAWKSAECSDLSLRTNIFMYPRWAMIRPIWLDVPTDGAGSLRLEYKYVIDRRTLEKGMSSQVRWEDGIANRIVELPCEDNRIWLVSDESWNHLPAAHALVAAVPRSITAEDAEEAWSCYKPLWTPAQKKGDFSDSVGVSPQAATVSVHSGRDAPAESSAAETDGPEQQVAPTDAEEDSNAGCTAISDLKKENAVLRERLSNSNDSVSDTEFGIVLALRKQISEGTISMKEGAPFSVENGNELLIVLASALRQKADMASRDDQDGSTAAPSTTPRREESDVASTSATEGQSPQKAQGARTPSGHGKMGGAFLRRRFFRSPTASVATDDNMSRLTSDDMSQLSSSSTECQEHP